MKEIFRADKRGYQENTAKLPNNSSSRSPLRNAKAADDLVLVGQLKENLLAHVEDGTVTTEKEKIIKIKASDKTLNIQSSFT